MALPAFTPAMAALPGRVRLQGPATGFDYSVYLGTGSQNSVEQANAMAVDDDGNVFVTGEVSHSGFPVSDNAWSREPLGGDDIFVTKLSPEGRSIIFSTYLGGSGIDRPYAIAVDGHGAVYVTGATDSPDYPTTPGAYRRTYTADTQKTNVFVTKLSADGSNLVYSTVLAEFAGSDQGRAIRVDSSGSAYVAGTTSPFGFPTTPGALDSSIDAETKAFVTKLRPDGGALVFSTMFGGTGYTYGFGLALGGDGSVYLAGSTYGNAFPTVHPIRQPVPDDQDSFVARISANGSTLLFSTPFGGTSGESALSVALDTSGFVYVAGTTLARDFPTTPGAFQERFPDRNSYGCAYVVKLSLDEPRVVYATLLSGWTDTRLQSMVVDAQGRAWCVGVTYATDFPVTEGAADGVLDGGGTDGFVAGVSSDGGALAYGSFLGTTGSDSGLGVAADVFGGVYACGISESPDFPATGFGARSRGSAFVVKPSMEAPEFSVAFCSPSFSYRRAKLDVTVKGSRFEAGSSVSLGDGIKVRSVTIVSSREITVSVKITGKAPYGSRDVTVTRGDGTVATGHALFEVRRKLR
ncbi:MAG TPA: SBBP repeat-containing protein [Blastocatellia bacterium]|nr:SBBP repeat-containing protein [Blastocatellia bacterium]